MPLYSIKTPLINKMKVFLHNRIKGFVIIYQQEAQMYQQQAQINQLLVSQTLKIFAKNDK
ncbi:hypothetical protein BpHYR1_006928 [Brachionus plicatilis]|uniref:Uncharacterized protein n=1 Tax=Brachionus plicatilis TaxID=10195 RepID=A0A3M7QDH0_BRAPC|nr:hypothetical protein BpHYR1_006928 [Brachionus plicatilis]